MRTVRPWSGISGRFREAEALGQHLLNQTTAQGHVFLHGLAANVMGLCFYFEGDFPRDSVGELSTEMVEHFFRSLAESLGAALHIEVHGQNTHHMVEACFKSVGRCLRQAVRRDDTKGQRLEPVHEGRVEQVPQHPPLVARRALDPRT